MMDTIVEGPPDDGGGQQDMSLVSGTSWAPSHSQEIVNNSSTLLYIAVEYVKGEYKMDSETTALSSTQDAFSNFDQHVSPLDPNMSSVARYSPVYNEPSTGFNPVVIHQLVTSENSELVGGSNASEDLDPLDGMPAVLCNNDIQVNNQYLQIVNEPRSDGNSNGNNSNLQLVPDGRGSGGDQDVKLLITDQATGMSYTVSTQELLVEPCLEDQQLLDAFTPGPLLDSDLLALDVSSLKTELHEDLLNNPVNAGPESIIVNNYISSLTNSSKSNFMGDNEVDHIENDPGRKKTNDLDYEDQFMSSVYNIVDQPVPTRARATLPENYLVINKIGSDFGVFAKKIIPKQTQFGPLEGIIVAKSVAKSCVNKLDYFMDLSGRGVHQIDISDENNSNWISFVRKAVTYEEMNLVVSQRDSALYFTTTKIVLPKDELKVGYSVQYAEHFNLPVLKAQIELNWSCFECTERFQSSEELQKHLAIHDLDCNENTRPRILKTKKKTSKKNQTDAVKCKFCQSVFVQSRYNSLKNHLVEKHSIYNSSNVEDNFTTYINYKCDHCETSFNSESLLSIHNLQHTSDNSEEQLNHVCPACQRKFPTQRQLVGHVAQHAEPPIKVIEQQSYKCPICHKIFPFSERLQRHMMVHGSEESKPLQCKTCNKRFLNNSALTCHLKTHYSGKKTFECPICKEGFDHVLKLKLHVPNHSVNGQYTCPHCNKIFKKYSIIRKHIRAFHCERKHTCPHCSKQFPTLDKLRMHLLKHSDHREFLCADCGKQFKRKDKLKEHCKRVHSEERENNAPILMQPSTPPPKKFTPKVEPTDFHRFIYKCHACLVGFKRRGMLVNHLAKRHPDISPDSVPELNLPILRTTRDYYCQYCDKVYKSSSKRKAHILKNHPGAALPMSNRKQGNYDVAGLPNPTFSQTVGSITTHPQSCQWCHKQYASKAKLLQHQRKKHPDRAPEQSKNRDNKKMAIRDQNENVSSDTQDQVDDISIDIDEKIQIIEDDILNKSVEEYNKKDEHDDGPEYCHLVPLSASDNNFEDNNSLGTTNPHLYRLLTTSNGLLPPR